MSYPPPPLRDPGLQPERTRLSWRRTVLAATVVALLALRFAVQHPGPAAALAVVVTAGGWLALLVIAAARIRALAAAEPVAVGWPVPLTTLVTLGYAGLGLALLVLV